MIYRVLKSNGMGFKFFLTPSLKEKCLPSSVCKNDQARREKWTGPCGSYYDSKISSVITMKKLKKHLLLIGPGNYMAHLGPRNEVVDRKKDLRECGLGFCFLLGSRVGV